MLRVPQSAMVAFLSAAAGAAVTLLLATLLVNEDPQLIAAEQRFHELPPATARQLKARLNSLMSAPDKHQHLLAIHEAVTADPDLDTRLTQLHAWWITRDDAQRAELRETLTDTKQWLAETQRQLAESSPPDNVVLSLRGFAGSAGRGRSPELRVSTDQIDQFLKIALPDNLSPDESQLLDSVDPEDRTLACVVVIGKRLFQSGPASGGIDRKELDRSWNAIRSHLLPEQFYERMPDLDSRKRLLTLAILKTVKDDLTTDFFKRHTVANKEVEKRFTTLNMSERMKHMMSDPNEAVRSLQTQLNSKEMNTPVGQLTSQLDRLEARLRKQFRREFQILRRGRDSEVRGPNNRRPGNDGRPRNGERPRRFPGPRPGGR